jgi:hypothetical protein
MTKSEREQYAWREPEVRESGPCDKDYDASAAEKRRELRSTPPPKDSKPKEK